MNHHSQDEVIPAGQVAPNIEQLTHSVIDQVVVDGEVDGHDRRVLYRVLVRIAFQGLRAPDDVYQGFHEALPKEERFVARIGDRYDYEPVLRPDSIARASLKAIVSGHAICSEAERQDCRSVMAILADEVFSILSVV